MKTLSLFSFFLSFLLLLYSSKATAAVSGDVCNGSHMGWDFFGNEPFLTANVNCDESGKPKDQTSGNLHAPSCCDGSITQASSRKWCDPATHNDWSYKCPRSVTAPCTPSGRLVISCPAKPPPPTDGVDNDVDGRIDEAANQ